MATKQKVGSEQERVYRIIQDLILTRQLQPGEAVTEVGLAEKLKVSRTPVREALNILEKDGLIVTHNRRKRVYVLTIQELANIFDLKISLEGSVASWAAQRGTKAQRKKLEGALKTMQRIAKDAAKKPETHQEKILDAWLTADRSLHDTLFEMADNQKAAQIISNLNTQWHRLRVAIYALEGRIEKAYVEHEKFVTAILDQDPDAAQSAMRQHLENLKKELIKILELFRFPA